MPCASINVTVQAHIGQQLISISSSSRAGVSWTSFSQDFAGVLWTVTGDRTNDQNFTIVVRSQWPSSYSIGADIVSRLAPVCPEDVNVALSEPGCIEAHWLLSSWQPADSGRDSFPSQLQTTISWLSALRYVAVLTA
jgi:hypothetical protein